MLHIIRRHWIVVPIVAVYPRDNSRADPGAANVCEIVRSIGRADRRERMNSLLFNFRCPPLRACRPLAAANGGRFTILERDPVKSITIAANSRIDVSRSYKLAPRPD